MTTLPMNARCLLFSIALLAPKSMFGQLPPVIPNDPLFSQQWNMKKIGATNAWAVSTGRTNIVVAIIDTGVDYTHPDLAPNMWRNPGETGLDAIGKDKATNGIDDDGNGYVDDVHGIDAMNHTGDPMDGGFSGPGGIRVYHGTQMAGVIGAVGNNGTGIAGVNWAVQIMAIRIPGDFTQYPPRVYFGYFVAAWDYILDMKRRGVNVRVVNNSYGFSRASTELADRISMAGEEGILAVFAALNHGVDQDVFTVAFPNVFNLPSMIDVASSNESDTPLSDSNFGRSTVHLAAPGANILSTIRGPGYQSNSGTSQACPHVTGAAALLLAANPDLNVDQLKAALYGSVDPSAPLRNRVVTNGRLNVGRAIEYLGNPNPPAIVIFAAPAGQRTRTNATIRVTFSRPMNRASVESALVITPPLNGTFAWTPDNLSFSFAPDTPFNLTTNYTVKILGIAQDESGGGLDGDFDRAREGSPADDFTWTFRFPILNDDFVNAQSLTGVSGSIAASNRYALLELDETSHAGSSSIGASVWYRWTPKASGWFTFDLTSGTSFDSLLAVYVGDRLDQLVAVAGNDNYGSRTSSRVSFTAVAGTDYAIAVVGKNAYDPGQAGYFNLSWYPTPPPVLTSFSPASAYSGQTITLNGTNFTGATRVLFNGVPAAFILSTNAALTDLQLTAIVPENAVTGPITVETPHGNVATAGSFTVLVLPELAIRPLPGTTLVELSWPATTGFNLQRAESLSPTTAWAAASVVSSRLSNGIRYVAITNAVPKRFFRLYRP